MGPNKALPELYANWPHCFNGERGNGVDWHGLLAPSRTVPVKLVDVRRLFPLLCLLAASVLGAGQPNVPAKTAASGLTPEQAQALVERALATELRIAQDPDHPMSYQLRKTSPRLTTTKAIVETRDGDVARLLSIDDRPLSRRMSKTKKRGWIRWPATRTCKSIASRARTAICISC